MGSSPGLRPGALGSSGHSPFEIRTGKSRRSIQLRSGPLCATCCAGGVALLREDQYCNHFGVRRLCDPVLQTVGALYWKNLYIRPRNHYDNCRPWTGNAYCDHYSPRAKLMVVSCLLREQLIMAQDHWPLL